MLIALVTHLFYSSGYLLDYYVNMDVYKEHCINQDRPELNCDGKCILAQKIAEAQKNQAPDQGKMTIPASMEYLSGYFLLNISRSFQLQTVAYGWYAYYNYEPVHKSFHPPQV